MAKAKGDWKSLLSRFEVRQGQVSPISISLLSQYEQERGFMLPHSYCGYCEVFGPGRIDGGHECSIYVPYAKNRQFNIDYLNESIRNRTISGIVDVDQFTRAVFFGVDLATSTFFWDPHEITNTEEKEYSIYALHRNQTVERISDSFSDFINNHCVILDSHSEDYEFTFTARS